LSFNIEDGSFSIPISFDSVPLPGDYYVQVFLKDKPADIPYAEKEDGLEVPGEAE